MNDSVFARISMCATILLGIAAMLGLLLAALVSGSDITVLLALAALGCAYVAQNIATHAASAGDPSPEIEANVDLLHAWNNGRARMWALSFRLQTVSMLLFVLGLIALAFHSFH
jgi:hypothetical protein